MSWMPAPAASHRGGPEDRFKLDILDEYALKIIEVEITLHEEV